MNTLYTIGYSNLDIIHVTDNLKKNGLDAVADVRSKPYSWNDDFCKDQLESNLKRHDIDYTFMGNQLGARPESDNCYTDGKADFSKMAEQDSYKDGIVELKKQLAKRPIALMCSEGDHLKCHRSILICKTLKRCNINIRHIKPDGSTEDHTDAEGRLLVETSNDQPDLFSDLQQRTRRAYKKREKEIAYKM